MKELHAKDSFNAVDGFVVNSISQAHRTVFHRETKSNAALNWTQQATGC